MVDKINRCHWCNPKNPLYIEYHDKEWGKLRVDDAYLFEMLLLESFQAGLSWECVLNKREAFREAFDGFDAKKIAAYDDAKKAELLENPGIIRNRLKINAAVKNAGIFLGICSEKGSFYEYLCGFTHGNILYDSKSTVNEWSDRISKDLEKRGMRFVGSTIIYAYLQAVGIINSHEEGCAQHMTGSANPAFYRLYGGCIAIAKAKEKSRMEHGDGASEMNGEVLLSGLRALRKCTEVNSLLASEYAKVTAEKNRIAPDCAACPHQCGSTTDYSFDSLEFDDPAAAEQKRLILAKLPEYADLANPDLSLIELALQQVAYSSNAEKLGKITDRLNH